MHFASIVLHAPGGPMSRMLWLPAQETSRARFAAIYPRTSRRSTAYRLASASICEVSTSRGRNDSGAFIRSTACGSDLIPKTRVPSTTAASRAFASGTTRFFMPRSRAASAADRAYAAVKRQLTEEHVGVQQLSEKRALAAYQSQGHRQIECGAFLADVGRRQVYGNSLVGRVIETTVSQRRFPSASAFPRTGAGRLLHCRFRGLLSVYSRYGLHARQVAFATLCTRGFSSLVASTAALIATGWSEPVPGRVYPRCAPAPFHGAPGSPTTLNSNLGPDRRPPPPLRGRRQSQTRWRCKF